MTGYPITDTQRIDIARYYLTHLDMTLRQVAAELGVSATTVDNALKYYQTLVRYIPPAPQQIVGVAPDELAGVRNDMQRFERLIIGYKPNNEKI